MPIYYLSKALQNFALFFTTIDATCSFDVHIREQILCILYVLHYHAFITVLLIATI